LDYSFKMVKLAPLALCAVLFSGALGSSDIYPTKFSDVTWNNAKWQLATTNLDQGHYQARKSLANGYLGINVAATGPFFEVDIPVDGDNINGWPLFDRRQTFATIAGFYATESETNGTNYPWLLQYGGESVIAGVPHWGNLMVGSNGHVLNASTPAEQITGFRSLLDMKNATMSWSYTWTPPGGVALGIEYTMLVHKLYVNMAAVQLKINATQDTNVTIIDALNGDCAVRSQFVDKGIEEVSIWSAVHPNWVGNVTAYIYSTLQSDGSLDMSTKTNYTNTAYIGGNMSSIATAVTAQIKGGKNSVIAKFIGGASTEAFPNPQATARNASISGAVIGFDCLVLEQRQEWATIMPPDSVDSYVFPSNGTLPNDTYISQLQVTAVTNPFNLIQNTIGTNAIAATGNNTKLDIWSIPVCGLGSSCYAGQIFWDAEVWMAPGLVVSNPQAAKQIANYRVQLFPQAKRNIGSTASTSRNATTFTEGGAVFPWTSGKYGNCTSVGPCFDYEYHLNGDIGLELLNYYIATGDVDYFREYLFPIYDAVAYFYGEVMALNTTLNKYILANATDPVSLNLV
jgi:trehalose/maltose hydrolase-like predicted phosphorylase